MTNFPRRVLPRLSNVREQKRLYSQERVPSSGGGYPDPNTFGRVTAFNGFDYAALGITNGSSGKTKTFVWDIYSGDSVGVGTDIDVDGTTSRITLLTAGIYSVQWSIYAAQIAVVADTAALFLAASPSYTGSEYTAGFHGGEPDGIEPTGSFTYYANANDLIDFWLNWKDIDTTVPTGFRGVYGEIMIQKHFT